MELKLHFGIFVQIEIILLIVPYGIETYQNNMKPAMRKDLLIVPYGIETEFSRPAASSGRSFNRTLWN